MSYTEILFQGKLVDFLPANQRDGQIGVEYKGRQSIKHLIEALGVPHPEVGRIEANGVVVNLNYLVNDQDRISVYPYIAHRSNSELEASHDVDNPEIQDNQPLFLLDGHLGKLAVYLRLLGFDTWYRNDYGDDELACLTGETGRILLTRDRRLLMRKIIQHGYCLRSLEPMIQVREVVVHFNLQAIIRPFQRCLRCNAPLQPVSKQAIHDRLLPLTKLYYDEFHHCPACDQIYWKGSHYDHMRAFISSLDKGAFIDG